MTYSAAEFFDRFANQYDAWYTSPEIDREDQTVHDRVRWSIKYSRARSLVDAGCGTGALLDRLDGEFPSLEIVGLDVSPRMILQASDKHPGKTFLVANMDRRFNLGRLFDLAVCNFAFNYFLRPDIAVENLYRLIGPGGLLMVTLLQPKRLLYSSCPHRFGLGCPVLFHGRGTFERGGFRVVVDRPFALTRAYNRPVLEDAVVARVPWLGNYRILICERT